MKDAVTQIIFWYKEYYADGFFLILAICAYIYLFVHEEKIRKKMLYPVAMLVFCILNPVLYYKVFKDIIYWRLFWLIPDAIMIAYAVTMMVRASKKTMEKIMVLLFVCGVIVIKGTNVYTNGGFTVRQNLEKVSESVVQVCDVMLEMEEEPRCILPGPLLSEARQYSGSIKSAYGRNAFGYILAMPQEQWDIYQEMEKETPDFDYILGKAVERNYTFVVTYDRHVIEEEILLKYNYYEKACVAGYRIYCLNVLE